jgi:hypothetical protein
MNACIDSRLAFGTRFTEGYSPHWVRNLHGINHILFIIKLCKMTRDQITG